MSTTAIRLPGWLAAILMALPCTPVGAQEEPQDPVSKAFAAARDVAQHGPASVALADQATLQLPEGYVFVPRPAADGIMDAFANSYGDTFLGLIFPAGDANWFVVAEYEPSGYIKDDDAKAWDVEELLASLREGTKAGNERRREAGVPELELVGWAESPKYDAATHRLVWSVAARDIDSVADTPQTINYNTYLLGREGYVTLNLVTDAAAIPTDKEAAKTLLGALAFNPGKTYADFDSSTDKVAAYGLAALVAGVAAKKLGLFALIAAFLVKFGKIIAIAAAAGGAALWKRYRSKANSTPA